MNDSRTQEIRRCRFHVSQPPNAIEKPWAIDRLITHIESYTNQGARICCVIQSIPGDWIKPISDVFTVENEFFRQHFRSEPDVASTHTWRWPSKPQDQIVDYRSCWTFDGFDPAAEKRTMRISYYRANKHFCKPGSCFSKNRYDLTSIFKLIPRRKLAQSSEQWRSEEPHWTKPSMHASILLCQQVRCDTARKNGQGRPDFQPFRLSQASTEP